MILNFDNKRTRILLPHDLIHPAIQEKYENFLGSTEIDGEAFVKPLDWLQHNIKNLNFGGGIDLGSVDQIWKAERQSFKKGSQTWEVNLFPRDISITFAPDKHYLLWCMVMEEMMRVQSRSGRENVNKGPLTILLYDYDEYLIGKITAEFTNLTSLSNITFSAQNVDLADDFTVDISINGLKLEILPEDTI